MFETQNFDSTRIQDEARYNHAHGKNEIKKLDI